MKNLKNAIYSNIVEQLRIVEKLRSLRSELEKAEAENQRIIGGINVLSALYRQETGRELQNDVNTSDEWKGIIERAMAQVSSEAKNAPVKQTDTPVIEDNEIEHNVESDGKEKWKLRSVAGNRTLETKKPVNQSDTGVERTRDAVKVIVQDAPQDLSEVDDDDDE